MNSTTQLVIFIASLSLWSTIRRLTLSPELERKLAREGPLTLALSFDFNHKHWLKINTPPSYSLFVHILFHF